MRKKNMLRSIFRSLSARKLWIEITLGSCVAIVMMSLSARKLWIEMSEPNFSYTFLPSLSARKLWIEISLRPALAHAWSVAFCEEAVD